MSDILTQSKQIRTPGDGINIKNIIRSALICLPFLALSLIDSIQIFSSGKAVYILPRIICTIFIMTVFFLIIYTKRTDKYRVILFITASICFLVEFGAAFYQEHGRWLFFTQGEMINGTVGYCPIAIPSTISSVLIGRVLFFPTQIQDLFFMLFLIIGLIFFGGRSWCSWHCMFAGVEEGMSRCRKKPVIKKRINRKWVYFSVTILIFAAIISPMIMDPLYCAWMCPVKILSETEMPNTINLIIRTVFSIALFVVLIVILPFVTGKRGQCAFICPLGALLGAANKISPFDIRIDKQKCVECKKCINECPTYALDEESISRGKTYTNCFKCGKCIDTCPKGAIFFHIKGTPVGIRNNIARMMFIYPTMLLYVLMGGSLITDALTRIFLLFTTGSMIK